MKYILNFAYLIIFILLLPKMLFRMFTQGRYKNGWSNRLGFVPKCTEGKSVWIHAVSVGEVNATKTIIAKLQDQLPEYKIFLSTTTDTGFARATALYGQKHSVMFFPMDFSFIMKKAFRRINPAICLLMELEVWPNFSQTAVEMNIPVVVANGRLSERSFPRYKMIKRITSWMFSKVTLFLSQSKEYTERFVELGVSTDKVIDTGSLKYDTAEVTDQIEGKDDVAAKLKLDGQRVWVAGGTGPDEEKMLLDVYKKLIQSEGLNDLRLVIVPRKPERFDEVAKLITSYGFKLARYSQFKDAAESPMPQCDADSVVLGDTMGDLRKFYALSEVVFVGRTLCPMGGSDMMESTAMKRFTTFGPHTFNFKQTVEALLSNEGAVEVQNTDELYETLLKALQDTEYAQRIASNGQEVIKQNQGATDKTLAEIIRLLS